MGETRTWSERPFFEALEYCCRHRQVAVWQDTDEDIRNFVRCTLFEDEENPDKAPFAALPDPPLNGAKEPEVLARWRKAREDALELWASEMSCDGDAEEGEEEE